MNIAINLNVTFSLKLEIVLFVAKHTCMSCDIAFRS